jgi:hypothetical protein
MECCSGQLQTPSQSPERKTKEPCNIPCSGIEIGGETTSALGRATLSLIDSNRQQKISQQKGLPVARTGALEAVVELGWLHAKMHHAHKDEEEKGIKDWIRNNAEAAND